MPRFALIADGAIKRISDYPEKPDPNPAKGYTWLPVENTPAPDVILKLEGLSFEYVIERDKVVQRWTVTRKPIEQQLQAVKDEARRRILARYPDWRQANMTARGVELVHAKTRKEWTPEEQAEADALQAAWDWVKAVRAASDVIEALQPIPVDFRDDKHWPER
jgi:hypothetical protein